MWSIVMYKQLVELEEFGQFVEKLLELVLEMITSEVLKYSLQVGMTCTVYTVKTPPQYDKEFDPNRSSSTYFSLQEKLYYYYNCL